MNWQRARTDDKKSERREEIYAAAFRLFKRDGYDKVSFNAIAAEAGFTKSNLYRYFSSKEDIYLCIFSDLFGQWVESCLSALAELQPQPPASEFAEAWLASMRPHQEYLTLATLLLTALERNSSFEQLQTFKRVSMQRLYAVAVAICRLYPQLSTQQGFSFLSLSFAATTHYWALATDNADLVRIYAMDEFQSLKPNFERDLALAIEVTLCGLGALTDSKTT